MKFTFKKEPVDGYSAMRTTTVKLRSGGDSLECGCISGNEFDGFKIRLMVLKTDTITDDNPNCGWRWITFNKVFKTERDARDTINRDIEGILHKYALRFAEC